MDLQKAKELYDEALANGCVEANYYEGLLYKNGLIKDEDADANKALESFELVKGTNDPFYKAAAALEIGDLYKNGFAGIERDYDKALQYYNEAINAYPYMEGSGNVAIAKLYAAQNEELYSRTKLIAEKFLQIAVRESGCLAVNFVKQYKKQR